MAHQLTLQDVVAQFSLALASSNAAPAAVVVPEPSRTFSGLPYEDPIMFLDEWEQYFTAANVTSYNSTKVATKHLHGDASRWYQPYTNLQWEWNTFKSRFLSEYASSSTLARLTGDLYGRHQLLSESVSLFLEEKLRLASRLAPHLTEDAQIAMLTELLHPRFQRFIFAAAPTTVEALLHHARLTERTFREDAQQRTEKTTKPKQPAPKEDDRPQNRAERSVPWCYFCPERHFHRDCPIKNARDATISPNDTDNDEDAPGSGSSGQQSGNANRVGRRNQF